MSPFQLSDREKVVVETIRDGRIGEIDQLAKDVITALYLAGYLKDDDE